MKKRIMSAALSAVTCISVLPFQMVTFADDTYCPFTGGSGTSADPYQIASSYDLQILSELVADSDEATAKQYSQAYYVQTKDIELKNVSFVPIGTHPGIGFSGSYDGNYYTISNLDIDTAGSYIGLFGWVNGGSIENLSVYGNVATTETDSGVALIGGVAGEICDGASVTNCSFNGTVTTDGNNAGGVVGQIARSGSVVQCYFNGTVTGLNRVRGVVGYVSDQNKAGELKVISCYAAGKVVYNTDEGSVGGITSNFVAGNAESVITVKNNYYLSTACDGAVNGETYEGCSKLSAALLKGAADLLGTPYVNNTEGDTVNDGYPIFQFQLYEGLSGDVNSDGRFNVADIVMMQKWLLCAGDLTDWKAGDLCNDGKIDVFDLCLMKRLLINMGGGVNYSLSLNKTSASLDLEGDASTLQLEATVQPESTKIIWGSSNTSVATVSDNGLVKAVGSGTAVITAKTAIGGRVASCKITVAESSIQLDKSSVDLYVGATATLSATVVPAGSAVTWKSADTSIATVSGGKITAVGSIPKGVTLTVTELGYSDSKYVWGKVTYNGTTGWVALWLRDRSESGGIITV